MKKLVTLLLLCAMLAPSIVACSDNSANNTDESNAGGETNPQESSDVIEETEEVIKDNLPEVTYDGYTYNIHTRTSTSHHQFVVEENTAEALTNAIYTRNAIIEDRFDITFAEYLTGDSNEPMTLVMTSDPTYSIMNVRCTAANTMSQKGYCIAIDTLEYIDLEQPYWDKELTESISIGSRSYTAIGSTNLTAIDFMNVLLFNKDVLTEHNLEDIYTLVDEGKWTFDKFGEMGAAVSNDSNGDGVQDASDTWGLLGNTKYTHCSLIQAADALYIKKDEEGYPYCEINTDEHFIDVFNKIFEVCNDNGAWFPSEDATNEATQYHTMFRNNQGLFLSTIFYYIETLRDMESDFGVIPYPKWDEAQENYISRVNFFDTAVIPTSVEDVDRTQIVFEALTCESFNEVIPAYKELALKGRYARDEQSAKMIDLILNNRVLDLGDTFYTDNIRDAFIRGMFYSDNRNIVSTARSNVKAINKTIEKAIEEYQKQESNQQ